MVVPILACMHNYFDADFDEVPRKVGPVGLRLTAGQYAASTKLGVRVVS